MNIQCPQCHTVQQAPAQFCKGCGITFAVVPIRTSNKVNQNVIAAIFGGIVLAAVIFSAISGFSGKSQEKPAPLIPETPENVGKSKNLRIEFSDNFGMTTWYRYFKNLSVKGETIEVNTFLADSGKDASGICGGISSLVYSTGGSAHNETIVIYGEDGGVLIRRNGISEQCR